MKVTYPRNKISARETDLIMGASMIKFFRPRRATGSRSTTYSPKCQLVSPKSYLLQALHWRKTQMAINIGSDAYPH